MAETPPKIGYTLGENWAYPREETGEPSRENGYTQFYVSASRLSFLISVEKFNHVRQHTKRAVSPLFQR